jgi:hypothetical protein
MPDELKGELAEWPQLSAESLEMFPFSSIADSFHLAATLRADCNCIYGSVQSLTQRTHQQRTLMTRMTQIIADKAKKFSANPRYPRHQRSIHTDTCRTLI